MIPISATMQAALASPYGHFCTCWKVTRTDSTVLGFTDHDRDLVIGGITYHAESGYVRTDIVGADDLSVDNLEAQGVLVSPSITEADLHAGLWDFAAIEIFQVNWLDFYDQPVASITRTGATATATVLNGPDLQLGGPYSATVAGAGQAAYNGAQAITVIAGNKFTYPVVGTPVSPATGVLTYRTNCGTLPLRTGWLGEVTVERDVFKGELRGLTQAYARTLGELTQPGCRAELYDARCKVDPAGFTVMGTLTDVSADGMTLSDSGRAEPGPAGGILITLITKANPGHVIMAAASTFYDGQPIMLSGITGSSGLDWETLNQQTVIRNMNADGQQFDLGISTAAFGGSYNASSGTVTPLGGESGYFDFGVITMTSGAAAGLSMEVKSYVPGQWTLPLPFPYLPAIGDTYTMKAGCDKSLSTCITKFSNVLNFRGEPYLPGLDKIVQTGKQLP